MVTVGSLIRDIFADIADNHIVHKSSCTENDMVMFPQWFYLHENMYIVHVARRSFPSRVYLHHVQCPSLTKRLSLSTYVQYEGLTIRFRMG